MIFTLLLWLPLWANGAPNLPIETAQGELPGATDQGRGTPYKVEKSDNLCGVSEARQLTVPAKVEYTKLLHATAEYKDLVRRKLDPASAKGIALMTQAHTRVVDACEVVRSNGSYCSVWKKIARRDGGVIPEVTLEVLKGL